MIKSKIGTISSDKMIETAVVVIERMVTHKIYQKKYRVTNRLKAHNPNNTYKSGDRVIIQEVKPISKQKSWLIIGYAETDKGGK